MTQTDTGLDLDAINRDDAHHIHPWTDFAARATTPPEVIVSGKGPYIETASGTRLLDANGGGLSAVTLGYGNTEIADAIADQVRQLQFYSHFGQFTAPPAAELAAVLAGLAPAHINHAHFGTSGSIANETAIRLIHFYFNQLGKPDKKDVIALNRGYHGSTLLSASLTGIDFFRLGFDTLAERIHHLPAPDPYHRPAGSTVEEFCDAQIDGLRAKISEVGPDRVACMIAEPIMTVGGVVTPPPGYLRRAQAVCREHDVLFVADEVVTGFGRLGEYFCAEAVFGARPDVITCAKGLTSGYLPLSATLVSDEIHEVISVPQVPGGLLTHGFTYSGHPVVCAAALKVIEIMERDDVCGHVREVGPYFEEQLATLADIPMVGDIRGSHMINAVELVADRETRAPFAHSVDISRRIARHAQARGAMIRPMQNIVIIAPPIVLTRAEIDTLVKVLGDSIEATAKDLAAEGVWHG